MTVSSSTDAAQVTNPTSRLSKDAYKLLTATISVAEETKATLVFKVKKLTKLLMTARMTSELRLKTEATLAAVRTQIAAFEGKIAQLEKLLRPA